MRKTLSTLFAVFAMLASGIAFAPNASAAASAYGCSGNLVGTYDVRTGGGTKYGVINVYYSSANGGTNCAAVVDTYWGTGTTKNMIASIWKCKAGTVPGGGTCSIDTQDNDNGYYSWYAGPVTVTGTASRCISVWGTIWSPSNSTDANGRGVAVHCG
ncbi:hypothetical protein [Streptomyces sp. NPDC060275]